MSERPNGKCTWCGRWGRRYEPGDTVRTAPWWVVAVYDPVSRRRDRLCARYVGEAYSRLPVDGCLGVWRTERKMRGRAGKEAEMRAAYGGVFQGGRR